MVPASRTTINPAQVSLNAGIPQKWFSAAIITYVIVIAIVGFVSLLQLRSQKIDRMAALNNAYLFFVPEDKETVSLTTVLKTVSTLHTVNLRSEGAEATVESQLHSVHVIAPSLVIDDHGHEEMINGTFAVSRELKQFWSGAGQIDKGIRAVLMSITLVGITCLFGRDIARWRSFLPVLGVAASLGLFSNCISCRFGLKATASLLLCASVLLLGSSWALVLWPVRSGALRTFMVFLCLATPIIQLVSLTIEPKLCWSCLGLTATFVAMGLTSLLDGKGLHKPLIEIPPVLKLVFLFSLMMLVVRQSLLAIGVIHVDVAEFKPLPTLRGHHISEFTETKDSPAHRLYLVTMPGCTSCESAKKTLYKNRLPFIELRAANSRAIDTFYYPENSFPTPLVIETDGHDQILLQRFGWAMPEDEANFVQDLQARITSDKSQDTGYNSNANHNH